MFEGLDRWLKYDDKPWGELNVGKLRYSDIIDTYSVVKAGIEKYSKVSS